MKKKFLFLTLMGVMLLPENVGAQIQPYNRQNRQDYTFDGHELSDVVVKPFGTNENDKKEISVARLDADGKEAYDDQVVFLYHPKTGRFLYADGRWGTEAVALHEGFGLPFNIVDPDGEGSPVKDYYYYYGANDSKKKVGYGFYCEAFEMGHYIGHDSQFEFVGIPGYENNGKVINNLHLYVDRGGADTGDACYDETLRGLFKRAGGDGDPKGWLPVGEREGVFNWHFEPVDKSNFNNDDNLKVYRLCIYLPNVQLPSTLTSTVDGEHVPNITGETGDKAYPLYKHYIKPELIDFFNDGHPYHFLTSSSANTDENRNLISKDEDIAELSQREGYDPADYYWQIVTRKDLKQKFLLDFDDPYNAKVETGNATFNIDNPDFSRTLEKTVKKESEVTPGSAPAFWTETEDGNVYTYNGQTFDNADNGRFTFMHPNENGSLTQTFKPYLTGLFRLDAQGFVTGNATAKLTLTAKGEGGGESKISVSDPVFFKEYQGGDLMAQVAEFMRNSNDNPFNNAVMNNNAATNTTGDWDTRRDDGSWDQGPLNITKNGDTYSIVNDQVSSDCLYYLRGTDEYGRQPKGVYIKGEAGDKTFPDNGDYWYLINGKGPDGDNVKWFNGQELTVKVGDTVTFGPNINGNEGAWQWWRPSGGDPKSRELEFTANYDSAGDYILTFKQDGKWYALYYTVKVEGTPDPSHVNVNNTGKPFVIDDTTDVNFKLTKAGDYNNAGYADQAAFRAAIAANSDDPRFIERVVGRYFYDETNAKNNVESMFFYVDPRNANAYDDITITLEFDGIDGDDIHNFIGIDNVRLTYAGDTPFIMDENRKLNTAETESAGYTWIPVYMNRKFNVGAWNAFVCPVPLNTGQVKGAFGDGVVVSEISTTGLFPNNPYVIKFNTVEFPDLSDPTISEDEYKARASKHIIVPGHFYLVKPSAVKFEDKLGQINRNEAGNVTGIVTYEDDEENDYSFVFLGSHNLSNDPASETGVKGHPMELLTSTSTSSDVTTWNPYDANNDRYPGYSQLVPVPDEHGNTSLYRNFYTERYTSTPAGGVSHNAIELRGSYIPQTIKGANTAGATSDDLTYRSNCYVFQTKEYETRLVHLNATGNEITLPGFRFYIHDIEQTGSAGNAKSFSFIVDDEDDSEATEIINALIGDDEVGDGEIYNIAGQKVKGKLSPGIYMRNGKKFLVK